MTDFNLLSSWKLLTAQIGNLSESELSDLINYEKLSYRRKYILERLHQRFCALRDKRERDELLEH